MSNIAQFLLLLGSTDTLTLILKTFANEGFPFYPICLNTLIPILSVVSRLNTKFFNQLKSYFFLTFYKKRSEIIGPILNKQDRAKYEAVPLYYIYKKGE